MNKDQIQGKWEQLKGLAKEAWGTLTDDDFKKAKGSAENLYGIIHEKYGDTKESIKAKLTHDKNVTQEKIDQDKIAEQQMLDSAKKVFKDSADKILI